MGEISSPPSKILKSRLGIFSGALGPLSDYFLDPPKLLFVRPRSPPWALSGQIFIDFETEAS